jgi:hypothetical protein
MQSPSDSGPAGHVSRLVWGTLAGAGLVAVGLGLAFLVIATPLIARLVPSPLTGSSQVTPAMLVWALSLAAGTALLVAGTSRLAATVASARGRAAGRSAVMRVMGKLPEDIVVAAGVTPNDGRPIPELVIGPFGVAIIHELERGNRLRQVGGGWEAHTREGWVPAEHPIDAVARDAERVRFWLTHGDLDFVVRVYAALVVSDTTIPRSATCAVISVDQIPDWLQSLPRQRSFSAGRRNHLLARIRAAGAPEAAKRR